MLLNQNLSANVKCGELLFFQILSNSVKIFPQKKEICGRNVLVFTVVEILHTKERLLLSPIRLSPHKCSLCDPAKMEQESDHIYYTLLERHTYLVIYGPSRGPLRGLVCAILGLLKEDILVPT